MYRCVGRCAAVFNGDSPALIRVMFLGSDAKESRIKGLKKTPTHRQLLRQTLESFAEWAALGSKVGEK